MLINEIRRLAKESFSKVVENRRHLHTHPELSFLEYETSAFVKAQLNALQVPWKAIGNTGIVAVIQGELSGNLVIALRADMDALPVSEMNEVDYVSQNSGVMHACGHDAHTASLLGTAAILQALKAAFGGTVKLIFQPGEEKLPGGASILVAAGVLENPVPQAVLGQHVMPSLAVGKVAFRKGIFLASMDELTVTVTGKGGHGAMPHLNVDPVLISAHIIIALQQVVSRFSNPTVPSVLSFGKVIADGAINIIPDSVYLQGTFRTMDEHWRAEAHRRMKTMAEGIAVSMGGSCEFSIVKGYPVLINDESLTHNSRLFAEEYLGAANVVDAELMMIAEDFAYYTQAAPSCFYLLGVGNKEKGITSSLHTPTFNIDEAALELSTGLMAYTAIRQLTNNR
jgi:amidohydrolase